jgi:hypothetical protein
MLSAALEDPIDPGQDPATEFSLAARLEVVAR